MIVAAQGDRDTALACFDEEIASQSTHVYGREFAVNAYVAAGFTKLASGDRDAARAAFAQASSHPKAAVGMLAIDRDVALDGVIADLTRGERHVEAALVAAGAAIVGGEIDRAVEGLDRMLTAAPQGPAGWIIPIDPMLAALREHSAKAALFAKLAARAA
jgi:methylmalonyl-CoA mutase cobalamin-binding subunit